jgi:hypothetical protein
VVHGQSRSSCEHQGRRRREHREAGDDQGELGTLKDLDDQIADALNDPTKMVTVKESSLPEDMQFSED